MEALLKSQAAMEVLAGISLAEFLVFLVLLVGAGFLIYQCKDRVTDWLENYRKKQNGKESLAKEVKECKEKIIALEHHHEEDMEKNQTNQAKYRQQSLAKQNEIKQEFADVKGDITELKQDLKDLASLISLHYEETERLKRNELREKLLNSFRYYTSLDTNPKQEWNEMEAEAFWHLFSDYEKLKGNGYIHSTVKPAMEQLKVVPF